MGKSERNGILRLYHSSIGRRGRLPRNGTLRVTRKCIIDRMSVVRGSCQGKRFAALVAECKQTTQHRWNYYEGIAEAKARLLAMG